MSVQRKTSQNLSEDLRKMMIPGLRTERLSEEGRDSLRQRVKAISITSKDKGEFSLPQPAAANEPGPRGAIPAESIDKAEKLRMDQHTQRFESMSDSQKSRMKDQMRRVRPLSIEERADVAQRDP